MKAIKLLLIIVLSIAAIIGAKFAIERFSKGNRIPPGTDNPRFNEITREIGLLKNKPWDVNSYKKVAYMISKYSSARFIVPADAETQQHALDLAYIPLLVSETKGIFGQPACPGANLKTLNDEMSRFLQMPSYKTRIDLEEMLHAIQAYYKALALISKLRNYATTNLPPPSGTYEVKDAQQMIGQATQLKTVGYINNCANIQNGLAQVPVLLDRRHLSFLESKVENYVTGRKYDNSQQNVIYQEIANYQEFCSNYGVGKTNADSKVKPLVTRLRVFKNTHSN